MVDQHTEYLPAPAVQARYAITDVTLWRWLRHPTMNFPQPLVINRRRLFRRDELETWERSRVRSAPIARPLPSSPQTAHASPAVAA